MTIQTLLHTMSVAQPRILIQKLADFSEALHSHYALIAPTRNTLQVMSPFHPELTPTQSHFIPLGPMMIQLLHTLIAWPLGLAL